WLGAIATVITCVGFGTVFVPIKKFEARDGNFVALMMSVGMLIPCMACSFAYSAPTVFPLALLAGVCYAIANAFSIFIMDQVGMAVGGQVWSVVASLSGWAIARYGLLGSPAEIPSSDILNIAGVIVLCTGGTIFAFVRSHPIPTYPAPHYVEQKMKIGIAGSGLPMSNATKKDRSSTKMRLIGLALAVFVGLLHGITPTPINYLRSQHNLGVPGLSPHNGGYMLSFSIGSLLISISHFTLYALHRRNQPFINVEIAVPSIIGGILYGIAISTLFVSIENLDQAISFPICSIAPGIVNTLWAIFYFKEIRGKLDLSILLLAYIVTGVGILIISLSKKIST
ncbi:hypothetical protein PMAYCL1PPCAC_32546, partial [Pristionchus mayeri]